jgi:LmbE family N-acetylglucosaminyl deacetylase
MVLAPHPDDFDAICVTMKLLKDNGNPISVMVLTSGASGVETGYKDVDSIKEKTHLREKEQANSCNFFGLPSRRLQFSNLTEDSNGHPEENEKNMEKINAVMQDFAPDMVFLPHGNDTNDGHKRIYLMVKALMEQETDRFIMFLNKDPKTIAMRLDAFTPYNEEKAVWKARMLRFHDSQQQRNLNVRNLGFDERVIGMDKETATTLKLSVPYAEAFELLV